MVKACYFFLLVFCTVSSSHAVEPVLGQQGMFYFNLSFDAGQSTKTKHDFGFRFDRTLTQPGETITMGQLVDQPAVFNLKLNNNGLMAFELNGVDYTVEHYVHRADEGGETDQAEEPEKSIDVPLGVIIGVLIGTFAIANGF